MAQNKTMATKNAIAKKRACEEVQANAKVEMSCQWYKQPSSVKWNRGYKAYTILPKKQVLS